MKTNYKSIVLVLFAVFSLGLWSSQHAGAAVTATALPMGDYLGGQAICVNNSGQSAGYLLGSDGYDHACFWDSEASTPKILEPAEGHLEGIVYAYPDFINSSGHIAGTGWDMDWGTQRGFFWTEETGMVDIGVPVTENYTYADVIVWGLNDNGQVLAEVEAYDSDWSLVDYTFFIWLDGEITELTYTDPDTAITSDINIRYGGINNSGQVAGYVAITTENRRAVLWEGGTATILTPDIYVSSVHINSSGQVAGGNKYSGQNPWIYTPKLINPLRFIDVTGQYPDMANGHIYVTGLNDAGQVLIHQRSPVIRAMLWKDDGSEYGLFTEIPLSAVGGPGSYNHYVNYLNEEGQALAFVMYSTYNPTFFWDPATPGGMAVLAPLTGTTQAYARINDNGLAVGTSATSDYSYLPCTWQTDGAAVNYPPVLDVSGAPTSGIAGIEITFTASANDPDTGDTLSFSLDPDAPNGATINSTTGFFLWTPNTAGQFTFTVRVADSQNFYDTEKVTIEVNDSNLAPTLTLPATSFSGVVGGTLTFTATATDPEGDALRFQLSDDAPDGATIDPTSGVFSWTPASAGEYKFNVEVVDEKGAQDSEQITVSVAASPLVVSIDKITRKGKWLKVLLGIENTGTDKINDVMVVSATLDGEETTSRLPIDLGANKDGGIKKCELKFNGPDVSSGLAMLSVSGSSSLGDFAGTIEVTVP